MLYHSNIMPRKIERILTSFSQFDFTLHHDKEDSKVVTDVPSCLGVFPATKYYAVMNPNFVTSYRCALVTTSTFDVIDRT